MQDLPPGARLKADNHLAEGETTGHFHAAVGEGVELYEHPEGLLLSAPQGATVVHQEHAPQALEPGQYDVTRVVEYDPFAVEERTKRIVID
jgi:hypothetical protein